MKKVIIGLLFFLCILRITAQENIVHFYVSSNDDKHNAGIALFGFNTETGNLKMLKEFDQVSQETYLALDRNNNFLYSINQEKGEISSFKIDNDGELKKIGTQYLKEGDWPCYIEVDYSNKFIFVANYLGGNVCTFKINPDGTVGAQTSRVQHTGGSKAYDEDRQGAPHPHMVFPIPNSPAVLVPDLGDDKVAVYKLSDQGNLVSSPKHFVKTAPASGPRHLALSPSKKHIYLINELNATISAYRLSKKSGKMKLVNTVRILPKDFKEFNKSSDIHVTPNGQYVYGSNRGHNSLGVCKINQKSGAVTHIGNIDSGGVWPRIFTIDPTGKYIIVANKKSNNMTVFEIDYTNGNLKKVSTNTEFPGVQCIKFITMNIIN